MPDTNILLIIGVLVVLALIGTYALMQMRRSKSLKTRFGSEYERVVEEAGAKGKAEAELAQRAKRVKKLEIQPLPPGQGASFRKSWTAVQSAFVDDPKEAIREADQLIGELMAARGYPVTDFEQRAADLSVDHGEVVTNYRSAHEVALRHDRGEAGTEDLRQAMIHYRALFEDLIEEPLADTEHRRAS